MYGNPDGTAVAQLNDAAVANFPELMKALAVEVANTSKPVELRCVAAISFKSTRTHHVST